jgi:hypothetical protein
MEAPPTGVAMKRCAQLGLGVRFRSVALFDSLQALHELKRYDARAGRGRTSLRFATLALPNKQLARSNKSDGVAAATKGRSTEVSPAMSNILKPIDLADRAMRRAVFAVLDAAEHRANRKETEHLLRMQQRDKHQVRVFIGGRL